MDLKEIVLCVRGTLPVPAAATFQRIQPNTKPFDRARWGRHKGRKTYGGGDLDRSLLEKREKEGETQCMMGAGKLRLYFGVLWFVL